jgi:exoribonuclease R
VPGWVLERLHELPETLADSGRRANQYENAILDLVEAGVLQGRVGERFEAVVVDVAKDARRGTVTLREDGVEAPVVAAAELPLGAEVTVVLSEVSVEERRVEFTLADGQG